MGLAGDVEYKHISDLEDDFLFTEASVGPTRICPGALLASPLRAPVPKHTSEGAMLKCM